MAITAEDIYGDLSVGEAMGSPAHYELAPDGKSILVSKWNSDGTCTTPRFRLAMVPVGDASPGDVPDPAVGQIWRRKETQRTVKITGVEHPNRYERRWRWAVIDGSRGQKTGAVSDMNWKDGFEFIAHSDDFFTLIGDDA